MTARIVTYEPDNSLKKGYFTIFNEIGAEVVENRWLTYQLFKRDFFTMYKQSFIGILWAFIIPIVTIGTFIVLNEAGIFTIGDINVPYPIYAILGTAFWQLFSTGLVGSSNALVRAGSMIVQINFSKKSLVFASSGQSIVAFLFQFVLLLVLLLYYKAIPSLAILLVPVLMMPVLLLSFGLGLILSIFNSIVRDVGNVISLMTTFLMFLTPILYTKPKAGILMHITQYNPLYYLVAIPRDLILTGATAETTGFLVSAALAIMVFVTCLILFHLTETRISERI